MGREGRYGTRVTLWGGRDAMGWEGRDGAGRGYGAGGTLWGGATLWGGSHCFQGFLHQRVLQVGLDVHWGGAQRHFQPHRSAP